MLKECFAIYSAYWLTFRDSLEATVGEPRAIIRNIHVFFYFLTTDGDVTVSCAHLFI